MREPEPLHVDIRADTRKNAALYGGLAVVAVGLFVGVALLYGHSGDKTGQTIDAGPAVDAGFDYGRYKTEVKILSIELERAPCDRGRAKKFTQVLNRAGDYRGTIAFVNQYLQNCEHYSRILWSASHAYQQLGQYDRSAEVNTRLIEERPTDSDFWWWRGQDHARLEHIDLADADYRQSLATKPNKFAARRYIPLMSEVTPCEVAWSIQYMIDKREDHVFSWMREALTDRYLAGECEARKGTGKTRIATDPGSPLIQTTAVVNSHEGRFLVQTTTAFTVLTRAFAETAGVSITDIQIPIYAAGSFLDGHRAIVDELAVGKTRAPKIVAVVVSELPGGVDGVLGQSYLWRFHTEDTGDALLIQAR